MNIGVIMEDQRTDINEVDAKYFRDKLLLERHWSNLEEKPNIKDLVALEITQDNYDKFVEEKTKEKNKEVIDKMNEAYYNIKSLLKCYLDLKEEYYTIISIWIIGTYFHDKFSSYPYLFFNAMRGSGKSRSLNLICKLSWEGEVMTSPTEAVLFRTQGTLGIDEFEGVANKDKSSVRELLNGAYKKGTKVFRMKKNSTKEGEKQVVEKFEAYRPIIMANIWGMEEVLGDRCINLILEKSDDPIKTRLIEDFENNELIENTVKILKECSLCNVVTLKNIKKEWNMYISDEHYTTHTTHTPHNTETQQTTINHKLFKKVHDSNIIGRNLEIFLPLFFISDMLGSDIVDSTIEIAKDISFQRKHDEQIESLDVLVYDFISRQDASLNYYSVKEITGQFREFCDEDYEWLNPKWFGRALKRLNLVLDRKRKGHGVEVMLDIIKAQNKLRMFEKNEKSKS